MDVAVKVDSETSAFFTIEVFTIGADKTKSSMIVADVFPSDDYATIIYAPWPGTAVKVWEASEIQKIQSPEGDRD